MSCLKDALDAGKFAITAEIAPPKGYDLNPQMEAAQVLRGKIHAANVTDMQGACLRATGLGMCIKLKYMGIDPILQITGRDRNRIAIMGDLLAAAGFGIDTMMAITGDHPVVGDCKDAKPVYDLDSVGILRMLQTMERTGCDCGGNPFPAGPPIFYKGACVTPEYTPLQLQISKLRQKVDAGAMFVQTQAIFDLEVLKRFMDTVDKAGIRTHIMAGIIPLKGAGGARFMNQNVPGIRVPQHMIDLLEAAAAEGRQKGIKGLPGRLGMKMAAELIAKIQDEKLCDGVHVMAVGAEKGIATILDMAGTTV